MIKIYFVFRNFPLGDIHPHAEHAVSYFMTRWLAITYQLRFQLPT
jgi:hypothetical protein